MAINPEDFWPGFGDSTILDEVVCDDSGNSLAATVMNAFDIPCSDSTGGDLPDLDIKRMDAIQVVKMSLMEESASTGVIYEPVMNAQGSVEFVAVGRSTGLDGSDVYYEIQSSSYKEDCSGVMVVGKKPLAYRREIEWHPIWEGGDYAFYDVGLMKNSCITGDFNQYCTIVYDDPHLNSAYRDGIDNLYEINETNPWDTITGYAYYISWDGQESDTETSVTPSSSSTILLPLELSLGVMQRRPNADPQLYNNLECFSDQGDIAEFEGGVVLEIPDHFRFESVRGTIVDKFNGVTGVFIVGREIEDLRGAPITPSASVKNSPEETDVEIWAKINKTYDTVISLDIGKHYQVAYQSENGILQEVRIVFADNSRINDPITFPEGGKVTFNVDPYCQYAIDSNGNPVEQAEGYILPTSPTGGILVSEIWVQVQLNTPSLEIYNPDGKNQKAREIAESLQYLVAPLVTVDEPAPIGFNGTLIDQTAGKQDHDPTTAQNFEDTPLEQALDIMQAGGGMTLTLSFLDEDQVVRLSGALYDYMNSGTGIEATYVCGPEADPELCGIAPNGGIVNSITYSYQDSNSYTISVNAGPKLLPGNLTQVDGGPSPKGTESYSATGTVIQDLGNHIHFKVAIDGFGDRTAVNMSPEVIRVGDKVNITVNNNPVEF